MQVCDDDQGQLGQLVGWVVLFVGDLEVYQGDDVVYCQQQDFGIDCELVYVVYCFVFGLLLVGNFVECDVLEQCVDGVVYYVGEGFGIEIYVECGYGQYGQYDEFVFVDVGQCMNVVVGDIVEVDVFDYLQCVGGVEDQGCCGDVVQLEVVFDCVEDDYLFFDEVGCCGQFVVGYVEEDGEGGESGYGVDDIVVGGDFM